MMRLVLRVSVIHEGTNVIRVQLRGGRGGDKMIELRGIGAQVVRSICFRHTLNWHSWWMLTDWPTQYYEEVYDVVSVSANGTEAMALYRGLHRSYSMPRHFNPARLPQ